MIKVWDCRMVQLTGRMAEGGGALVPGGYGAAVGGACEVHLVGHEYAVRKVQWSPHRPDLLASASYDMTCRVYVLSLSF
jgi:peroxin-7